MSKRTGDRAKFNREHKKRVQRRKRTQELQQTLRDAPNPAGENNQPVTSRLRQKAGEEKTSPTAFEVVVYQALQGRQHE